MKLRDLSPECTARLRKLRYDCIVEKHEGPEKWSSVLDYDEPEFLEVDGRWVLLPIPSSHHDTLTVLRSVVGDDGNALTLFLKDTTHAQGSNAETFSAGFIAICDRLPSEPFFVAIVYHEWFMSAPLQLK